MKTINHFLLYMATFMLLFFVLLTFLAKINQNNQMLEYQLGVSNDSIYLYDGVRHVGTIPISNDTLSTIILRDNE